MKRRILICGDRNWQSEGIIDAELVHNKDSIETIIEGEAKGADKLSKRCAQRHGIPFIPFPAKWTSFGRAAGPIRNTKMLQVGKPTEIWAFHNNIRESIGTANMVIQSAAVDLPIRIYSKKKEGTGFEYLSSLSAPIKFKELLRDLIEAAKNRKKKK